MAGVNYLATFIAVADDCPAAVGTKPPLTSKPTTARVQYEMLLSAPYRHTSEDVIFAGSTAGRALAGAPEDEYRAAQVVYSPLLQEREAVRVACGRYRRHLSGWPTR
jgi:hypothetical protein